MTSHFLLTQEHVLPGTDYQRTAGAFKIVLILLFVANVYDPGGAFGLKYLCSMVAAVFSLWGLRYFELSTVEIAVGSLLFIVWPIWSLLYGVAQSGDVGVGLSQVTPFAFALLVALLLAGFSKQLPLQLFFGTIFSLAIFVVVSFVLIFLFPQNPASVRLFDTLVSLQEREGYFGSRPLGDTDVPIIYFGSTLFLIPAFVYYLFSRRSVRAGVVFIAIVLTWSKAGLVIALASAVLYLVWEVSSRFSFSSARQGLQPVFGRVRTFGSVAFLGLVVWTVFVSFPAFSEQLQNTIAGESETARIRKGHIQSLGDLFSRNPHYLLVGQGVGVPFFTVGESESVQNIEVDHLNAIRKFGIPWFLGFSGVVFFTAGRLIKTKGPAGPASGFALVSMYIAAGTNPVLMSPLFIMLMTLSYFAQRQGHVRAG